MKRAAKISGIVLLVFLAGSFELSAQHRMMNKPDSTTMNMMRMHRQRGMAMRDSSGMGRMRHFMNPGPYQRFGMHYGMAPRSRFYGHDFGMRWGMDNGDRMWRGPMGPENRILQSIPNVTEKQKQEIKDLRDKQQADMKKFREEMSTRMKEMRDSHRKALMNILTDDQKKFLEIEKGDTGTAPSKSK